MSALRNHRGRTEHRLCVISPTSWTALDRHVGALTAELVTRLGSASVSAVDPSELFVAAAQERHAGVSVQRAAAEQLPFADQEFDAALAQLVVHFMAHPVVGLREMARVTRKHGVVAACVWDHAGGQGPLSLFWEAARDLDPDVEDESQLAGAREGHLAQLLEAAGLHKIEESTLSVSVEHRSFEEWWEPCTLGVGPAGGRKAASPAARTLPQDAASGTVRTDGPGLGGPRPCLAGRHFESGQPDQSTSSKKAGHSV